MGKYRISGVPITVDGKLVGIITNRDMRFEEDMSRRIGDIMTKENLITAPVGTSLAEAKEILRKHRIENYPLSIKKVTCRASLPSRISKSYEIPELGQRR